MIRKTPAKTMAGSIVWPYRTTSRCSNNSDGSSAPDASKRSLHLGRTGRPEASGDSALLIETRAFEQEDVLHRDHVALHARDFGNLGDVALAVGLTRDLDDQMNR